MVQPTFLLQSLPGFADAPVPRANRLIVTVYGDVVEPRGGSLWMGSLIDVCADHGISESLVRTAVSRLVSSGHLEGERVGRRSFYRLTDGARAEFARVARLFYGPQQPVLGWRIALDRDEAPGPGWAALGGRQYLTPDLPEVTDKDGADALSMAGPLQGDVSALARNLWPVDAVAEGYRAFCGAFAPMRSAFCAGTELEPRSALTARLHLIHRFRLAVLADPRLPDAALPASWPGEQARVLFSEIYDRLAAASDVHIATLLGGVAPLAARTEASRRRQSRVREVLGRQG